MFLLLESECQTLQQELSPEEEQEWRKTGKLNCLLNIGDNDWTTPNSMEGPVVQIQVMNEETSKTSSASNGKGTGPTGVSDSVVEYGLILQIIQESGSDHSGSNCKPEEPESKGSWTTKLVPQVDVPDKDINNSGRCTKSGKVESTVSGALHSICP